MVKNMGRWLCILVCFAVLLRTIFSHPVTSEDENVRHTRQPDECCPCPVSSSRASGESHQDDQDQESNVPRASLDAAPGGLDHCPCMLRDADSQGSSSMLVSNPVRSLFPFMRSSDSKDDTKPLLHPEVDLASSVLETLKEATDEEYRDAVARDAARNAAKVSETSLSIMRDTLPAEDNRKMITIVINPEDRSTADDVIPDESHVQEARCILPPLGSSKLGQMRLMAPKSPNLLKEIFGLPELEPVSLFNKNLFDMDNGVGASTIQERVFNINKGLEKLNLRSNPSLLNLFPNSLLKPNTKQTLAFPKNIFESHRSSQNSLKVNDHEENSSELDSNRFSIDREDTDLSPSNLNEQIIIPEKGAEKKSRFELKSLDSAINDHTSASATKPFDLKKLLKLRDVELIPTNDVINKINKIIDQAKNTKKFNIPDLKILPNLISTSDKKDSGINTYSLPKLSDIFGNPAKLNDNIHKVFDKEVSNSNIGNTKSNSNVLIIPKEKSVNTKIIDTVTSPSELQLNCNDIIDPGVVYKNTKKPIIPQEKKIKTNIIDTISSSSTVQPNCEMTMDLNSNLVETEIIDSVPAIENYSIEQTENAINGEMENIETTTEQPNRQKNIENNLNSDTDSTSNNLSFGVCNAEIVEPIKRSETEKTKQIAAMESVSEFEQNAGNDQDPDDIINDSIKATDSEKNLEESKNSFSSVTKNVPEQIFYHSHSIEAISREIDPESGEPETGVSSSIKNKILNALEKLRQQNISFLKLKPEEPSISENDNKKDSDKILIPDNTVSLTINQTENLDSTSQLNEASVHKEIPEKHRDQKTVSVKDLHNDIVKGNTINDITKATDSEKSLEKSEDSFSSATKNVPEQKLFDSNSTENISREIDPFNGATESLIPSSIKNKILDALEKLRQPNISFLTLRPEDPSTSEGINNENTDETLMPDNTVSSTKNQNENLDFTTQLNEASMNMETPEKHRGIMTSVSMEDLQKMSDSILFASDRKNHKIDLKGPIEKAEKPNTELEKIPEQRENVNSLDFDPSFTEPNIQVDNLVSSVETNEIFLDDITETEPANEVESMLFSEEVNEDFLDKEMVPQPTVDTNMNLNQNPDFLSEDDIDMLSPDGPASVMTKNKSDMKSNTYQELCRSTSLSENKESNIKPPTIFQTEPKEIIADGSEKIIATAPLLNYKSFRDDILGSLQNIKIEPPPLKKEEDLNIFKKPLPDLSEILNLKSPIHTLDDIRSEISSMLRLDDPKSQEMFTDASTDNLRSSSKSLKDINLDIFQLQPLSLAKKYPITSPLPSLNLNTYKSKLAVPESLKIKPLTLKSAVSNNGGVLGTSLSFEPNKEGFKHKLNPLPNSNLNWKVSDSLKDNLELKPSRPKKVFMETYKPVSSLSDNLRLYTEDTMQNLKYPKGTRLREPKTNQIQLGQSLTNPIDLLGFSTGGTDMIGEKFSSDLNSITDNIRSQAESAMRNLQKTLKLSLGDIKLKDLSTLSDSFAKPEDILDVVTRTHEDVNDKLQSLHYDFTDRLASIRESIIDSTKFPSSKDNKIKIQAKPLSRESSYETGKQNPVVFKTIQSKTIPSRKTFKKTNNLSDNNKKLATLSKSRTAIEERGTASSPVSKIINVPKFKSSFTRQPIVNKQNDNLKLEPTRSDKPISRLTYKPIGLNTKTITKAQQRNILGDSKSTLSLPTTTIRSTALLPVFKHTISLKSGIAKPNLVKSSKIPSIIQMGNQRPSKYRMQTIKDTSGSPSETHLVKYPTSLKTKTKVSIKPLTLFNNEETRKKSPKLDQDTKVRVTNNLFDTNSSALQLPKNIQFPKLNLPLLSLPKPLVFESPLLSKARDALAQLSSNNLGVMITNKRTNTKGVENEDMARSQSENVNVEVNHELMKKQPMKENITYKCSMKCTKERK